TSRCWTGETAAPRPPLWFRTRPHAAGFLKQGSRELGFRVHFEKAGAGPPGFVSSQLMLAGRGKITSVIVGQFNREGPLQGALRFQPQTRDRKSTRLKSRHVENQLAVF